MRIASVFSAIVIASSAVAYASSSDAAIVVIKVTGDVLSGRDYSDVYDYGGSLQQPFDLTGTGSTFEAIFLFDTTISPGSGSDVGGGDEYGDATPTYGGTFRINDGPVQFTRGSYYGALAAFDYLGSTDFYVTAQDRTEDGAGGSHASYLSFDFRKPGGFPNGLDEAFDFDITAADQPYGIFFIQDRLNDTVTKQADAILRPTHITKTVSGVAAVPEPATWAMMLFGFGGIGATLRRRRRQPALAA
jgi:hypothetical protein